MTITILRPSQRVIHIPGIGVRISGRAVSAGGNWWEAGGGTCLAAYQPKGAASYAASRSNVASPGTNNLAELGVAPGWNTAVGYTPSGAGNDLLDTGIAPADPTGYSLFAQITGATSANLRVTVAGALNATYRGIGVFCSYGNQDAARYYCNTSAAQAPSLTAGNLGIAGSQGYRNGIADGAAGGVFSGAAGPSIWLLSINLNGIAWGAFHGNLVALAIYSDTVPDPLSLATAMAAL